MSRAREVSRFGRNARGRSATALRLAGASYQEIAEVLEFKDATVARKFVTEDLCLLGGNKEDRDELREIEGERLNRLLRGVWQDAIDPNSANHITAARTALSLIDRRIRLYGLDAPEEVIVHSPSTSEIDAWVMQLMANQEPEVLEGEVVEGY